MMGDLSWCDTLELLADVFDDRLKRLRYSDIIDFCFSDQKLRARAESYLKSCNTDQKRRVKNNVDAAEWKERGNKAYQESDYTKSLSLYTRSIFCAEKDSECLPLAFSNRSLVLQQMGIIPECIQDIDMALSTGYPKNKQEKLMLRKANCLIQMGEVDKAREVLKEAKKKPGEISKIIEEATKLKDSKNDVNECSLPELTGGRNENFVSASNHVSVAYSETKGRHVIATHDIQMGDVLFVEKPFSFVVLQEACYACCKELIAPIPCWNCLDATYCSPKCRDDFWSSVHSFECGHEMVFKSVGIAHLSLRIILSASSSFSQLKRTLSRIEQPKYEEGIVSFKTNGYDSVYNLVHHTEKHEANDLFKYAMSALLLALHLKNHTHYFSDNSQDEDLKLLTATIWRHILQLVCNGHAITNIFFRGSEQVLVETEERVGTAIFPSASMMNHSCEPSIINSFYKTYLIVRASKDIKKGEEVFNCYGPHSRRMSREKRQEILRSQYFFNCECQACLQPFDIQEKFTALKCKDCGGPTIPKGEHFFICLDCGTTSGVTQEVLKKKILFSKLMEEGRILADRNKILALRKFLISWQIGREIFYKYHKDLCEAANQVAYFLFFFDIRRCVMFLKCCLLSIEHRFGVFSIELANEMKKTGEIIYTARDLPNLKDGREIAQLGVDCLQRAERIIRLLHGPHHRELKNIRKNKGILEVLLKNM